MSLLSNLSILSGSHLKLISFFKQVDNMELVKLSSIYFKMCNKCLSEEGFIDKDNLDQW